MNEREVLVADNGMVVVAVTGDRSDAVAVAGGLITAVARGDAEVQDLLQGIDERVVHRVAGVLQPLFIDTHNHLALTARNELGVPMQDVKTLADIVARVRERAATLPAGEWVLTAADWHESQLEEGRFPTAIELDEATDDHPVLVARGGHNGVLNTRGLQLAGITKDSGDIEGGWLDRADDGTPLGPVQDAALTRVQQLLPVPPTSALVNSIETVSRRYRTHGIAAVRDAAVAVDDWRAMETAHQSGRLHVRVFAMIFSPAAAIAAAGSMDHYLDQLETAGLHPGDGDDMLRLWGIKLVLDGGVEAAALREPYAGSDDYRGTLLMDQDLLQATLATCVRRGWPVGVHALGDAAIDAFLDAVEYTVERGVGYQLGAVVLEHGGLIDAGQIRRAVALKVHITCQQALLAGLVVPLTAAWGADRVGRLFPWDELLAQGASISAGTDHPIGPVDPIEGIIGMTTRRTALGITGPEHAVDRLTALQLYRTAGANLLGSGPTGVLAAGAPADFGVYPVDLATAPLEALSDLTPTLTTVAGVIQREPRQRP